MIQVDDYIMSRNKLISEFMGWKPSVVEGKGGINLYYLPNDPVGDYNCNCKQMNIEGMKYHTSWDWLMNVVEKIENLNEVLGKVTIELGLCIIEYGDYWKHTYDGTKIKATYTAIVAFIEWYNTQNKQ